MMRSRSFRRLALLAAALGLLPLEIALACPSPFPGLASPPLIWCGVQKHQSNFLSFTGNECDSNCAACPDPCPSPYAGFFVDPQDSGDPVDVATGDVSVRVTDLVIPGRGIDWTFERRYRSRRNVGCNEILSGLGC